MSRTRIVCLLFVFAVPASFGQVTQSVPSRDTQAISILQRSLTAMAKGATVSDVTLSGRATRIAGSDQESGQVILEAKGARASRVTLSLSGSPLTEVRSFNGGAEIGAYVGSDTVVHAEAAHNCFTDAGWFSPVSAISSELSNSSLNVAYVGPETLRGASVQHVSTWQSVSSPDTAAVKAIAHLSQMDWYLDSTSALPVAVRFTTHPQNNSSVDLVVEIRFSNYQAVSGILVPFRVQKFLNYGLALDLTINSVIVNSGIPESDFVLQ